VSEDGRISGTRASWQGLPGRRRRPALVRGFDEASLERHARHSIRFHVRFIIMAPQSFCVRKCKTMKMPVGKREYDRFSRLIGIWRARRV
jgi:hypothetical protein